MNVVTKTNINHKIISLHKRRKLQLLLAVLNTTFIIRHINTTVIAYLFPTLSLLF